MAYLTDETGLDYAQTETVRIDLKEGGIEINGEFHKELPQGLLKNKKVILGTESDPLFPFEKTLAPCLSLLKMLASETYQSIELRTCSPLILLATPVLKQFKEKLLVCLKVHSEAETKISLPRKNEIIEVAKVLREHSLVVRVVQA